MGVPLETSNIHAAQKNLEKIFCSDYEFSVPDYQRPYSWGEEQALQLLDDLLEALRRNPDEPYFLGSVVLVKDTKRSQAEVIDGQQRLTTLTILISVLRELSEDPDVAAELYEMVVEKGRKTSGIPSRPRLHLRERDRAFFEAYIQTPGKLQALFDLPSDVLETDAQLSVKTNAQALHKRLKAYSEDQRLALITMLVRRTYLVTVATEDLDSAHRIFSVMNARGLDLSPADIFKAEVIGKVDQTVRSDYAAKWEDAEVELGRDDFADLFIYIRMIFAKTRGQRELLKEFREQVLKDFFEKNNAAGFVDDVLLPYARAYRQLRDADYSSPAGADSINRWFIRLSQLDNNDWKAPVLWALKHHGHDSAWLEEFLRKLERLAASMLIRRVYATPRAQRYADLLKDLDNNGFGLDAPSFELDDLERVNTIELLDGPIYESKRVVKYVLLRLDETMAGASGVTYQHRIITVEHVLPQNPPTGSKWLLDFDDDDRHYWTHRMANLVLLNHAKNAQASNSEFERKKSQYFTGKHGSAPFSLTIQVNNTQDWTPAVLKERQPALLTTLKALWYL